MRTAALLVSVALAVTACSGNGSDRAANTTVSPATTGAPAEPSAEAEALCADATVAEDPPRVATEVLDEISGVAVSRQVPGVLWVHNDSGGEPEVHAVDADGNHRGQVRLAGTTNFDWEDISSATAADGSDHLFVGDIGDTLDLGLRDGPIVIHRIAEPPVPGAPDEAEPVDAVSLRFTFEDGPRDAETLMVDPDSGDLLVVSKQFDGEAAGIYRIPPEIAWAAESPEEPIEMERVGDVADSDGQLFTAGDISGDGTLVGLRTYGEVWLWDRSPGVSIAATLAEPPTCRREVDEPQGEAFAFATDGRGFVTLSEGIHQPVLWHLLGD